MASTVGFPGSVPLERLHQQQTAKLAFASFATKTICRFGQGKLGLAPQNGILRKRSLEGSKERKPGPPMVFGRYLGSDSSSLSPSDTVKEFYKCINEGNLKQLGGYISADCNVDECSFPVPFQDKKEVLQFFKHLIEGMGENVKFKVNRVCEGDELIAAANWHLEWKNNEIPFTRGCSFFECRKEGGKIMIKKAQIVIESPVKPGAIVLQLLKIVTKIFDNFPTATTWFLKSHQMILHLFLRIYNLILTIFINPFLKSYLQVWSLTTRVQGHGFNIFLYILKHFINNFAEHMAGKNTFERVDILDLVFRGK